MTPYSDVIDRFERKIQKDKNYFCYGKDLTDEQLAQIINTRSLGLLEDATDEFDSSISIQQREFVDFSNRSEVLECFEFDLTRNEIDLISDLMVVKYFDETLVELRALQKYLGKDIVNWSPNEERKTFLEMVRYKHELFDKKIASYNMINRNTGEYLLAY